MVEDLLKIKIVGSSALLYLIYMDIFVLLQNILQIHSKGMATFKKIQIIIAINILMSEGKKNIN